MLAQHLLQGAQNKPVLEEAVAPGLEASRTTIYEQMFDSNRRAAVFFPLF